MSMHSLMTVLAISTMIACQNTKDQKSAVSTETPTIENTKVESPAPSEVKPSAQDRNPAVLGKWKGTEWLITGRPTGMDATQVNFEFKADGTFQANYADQHKAGVWHTNKDSLYTTETGKKEVPIKLLKADGTSLDFEMNVRGRSEVLKFKKQ